MSVSPFHSVMSSRADSRAAFDAGQHQTDVVSNLNLTDIAGQPPLSQGREQNIAIKFKAPPLTPLTLDLGGNTYGTGSSEVNSAGILKSYAGIFGRQTQSEPTSLTFSNPEALKSSDPVAPKADIAVKNPETMRFNPPESGTIKTAELKTSETDARVAANADSTAAKTSPALHLPNFVNIHQMVGDKYSNATYDLSIQHGENGSVFKHKYTAADFSTCTMSSRDGAMSAIVTDPYARPIMQEDIGADGKSRTTRLSYNDEGNRKSMFASSKEITEPDGTVKKFNYDKFGKVLQA